MARIIFMGSPEEVVAPLRHLRDHGPALGLNLVAVVSQPARPVGRGGRMTDPPVALFAKASQIPCLQPESAKSPEFIAEMTELAPDIIVTAAYGQILSERFLEIPKIATINIHPSKLPLLRGATPVPGALLEGMTTTAVSILFTVKKLDAGNIILQKDFPIEDSETGGALTARLFAESGTMLIDALTLLAADPSFKGTPQDEASVTFCKKIDKDMGAVDWSGSAETLVRRFRAFEPWPGTWTMCADRRVAITEMRLIRLGPERSTQCGKVAFDKGQKILTVECGFGVVGIGRLKPAGGKDMDAAAFWNGIKDKSAVFFKGLTEGAES